MQVSHTATVEEETGFAYATCLLGGLWGAGWLLEKAAGYLGLERPRGVTVCTLLALLIPTAIWYIRSENAKIALADAEYRRTKKAAGTSETAGEGVSKPEGEEATKKVGEEAQPEADQTSKPKAE